MNMPNQKQPIICVSGAAETSHCGDGAMKLAYKLGEEIAKQGCITITGATTGFPGWSAAGAKKQNGISIGISPAANLLEHVENYKLPTEDMDLIMYTGFGFPGRDLMLIKSSEGVIYGCGRIGTIHEFTIAFEECKPVGILRGPWATDEDIENIIKHSNRPSGHVVYDSDPVKLVAKIKTMILAARENKNICEINWQGE
jgi:hypothetical protein